MAYGLANRRAGRSGGAGLLVQLLRDALFLGKILGAMAADIFFGGIAHRVDIGVRGGLGVHRIAARGDLGIGGGRIGIGRLAVVGRWAVGRLRSRSRHFGRLGGGRVG